MHYSTTFDCLAKGYGSIIMITTMLDYVLPYTIAYSSDIHTLRVDML